jgi:hypothetical protein
MLCSERMRSLRYVAASGPSGDHGRVRWIGVSVVAVVLVLATALVWALRGGNERSGGAAPSEGAAVATEVEAADTPLLATTDSLLTPVGGAGGEVQAARTAVAVAPLVLAVFDPDGAPLAGGHVVVFQDAHVLGHAVSGASGEVRFTLSGGEGEVAVWAPWLPAHRQSVALQGRHELRLARGAAVAGLVLVDGLPPGGPVELQLFSDSQVRPTEYLPPSVRAALGLKPASHDHLRARTGANGRFRFPGLPQGWSGRIRWEAELFLVEGPYDPLNTPPREVALAEAREDVVLQLAAPGLLKARFVRAGGKPIGSASVEFDVPALEREGSESEPCAADGTYRRLLQLPFPDEIVLRVDTPGREVYAARFRSPPAGGALWDLGDVVVPPAPGLRVQVRDVLGEPVVGAQVNASARGRSDSHITFMMRTVATDGAGMAVLEVREDVERVRVEHPGYAPVVEPAPLDLATTVIVTLRPAATLLLDFEILPERHFVDLYFTYEVAVPEVAGGTRSRLAREVALGIGLGVDYSLAFSTSFDATSGIAPAGVPLRLRVTDPVGRSVHEDVLPPLAPGETRKHRVKVDWKPATLRLRVLDSLERPIAGAGVMSEGIYRFWTGPDGEVVASGLAPGPMALTITHRLHAELALPDLLLSAQGEPLVVHLAPR